MEPVIIGYSSTDWFEYGVKTPIFWDTKLAPHGLIAGPTGGGKTVEAKYLVYQLLDAGVDLYICDFKAGGDWTNIVSSAKYGEYRDCDRVFDCFFADFSDAMQHNVRRERWLLFDEVTSWALAKDTKEFKTAMSKLGQIAFMGRSFGYHLLFVSQRFDAKVIDTAIREQFGVRLHVGQITTESAGMLFPGCEINKGARLPRFCGYCARPEAELDVVQFPYIENAGKLKKLLQLKGAKLYG